MNIERWQELKGKIQDEFEVLEQRTTQLEPGPGEVETLVFRTPTQTLRLEFTVKPRVIGERGMGSRRIGSQVMIERRYSPTEQVTVFKVFRHDPASGSWTEMSPDAIT